MGRRRKWLAVVGAVAALSVVSAACSSNDGGGGSTGSTGSDNSSFQGVALTGAGATFPDPIYEQWFQEFVGVESGAQINYQPIGSGGGIEQFTAQTVDFGASDAPVQDDEAAAIQDAGGDFVEIPTVLGGVVLAYNVAGLDTGLQLDGQTAADIFLGTITKWNDPAIAQQNPDAALPDEPISVVHRSDESGTTFVFTSWLASQSPDWESQVGADKDVQWPTGTGGDGNDGVAAGVAQTEGAIGYLSFDFAVTSNLGVASVAREDGTYVAPSIDSISAAGGGLSFPIAATTNILNSSAAGAYPITSTTYLLIYTDQTDRDKAQTLVDFVYWALTQGQPIASQLNYSPLPSDIATQGLDELAKVTVGGTPVEPSAAVSG
jgi:phosphate transport system substrate-binding protein